jgi:hypothetical protein
MTETGANILSRAAAKQSYPWVCRDVTFWLAAAGRCLCAAVVCALLLWLSAAARTGLSWGWFVGGAAALVVTHLALVFPLRPVKAVLPANGSSDLLFPLKTAAERAGYLTERDGSGGLAASYEGPSILSLLGLLDRRAFALDFAVEDGRPVVTGPARRVRKIAAGGL